MKTNNGQNHTLTDWTVWLTERTAWTNQPFHCCHSDPDMTDLTGNSDVYSAAGFSRPVFTPVRAAVSSREGANDGARGRTRLDLKGNKESSCGWEARGLKVWIEWLVSLDKPPHPPSSSSLSSQSPLPLPAHHHHRSPRSCRIWRTGTFWVWPSR